MFSFSSTVYNNTGFVLLNKKKGDSFLTLDFRDYFMMEKY